MITSGLLVLDNYHCACQLLMLSLAENFELKGKLFISTVKNKVFYFSTCECNRSHLFQLEAIPMNLLHKPILYDCSQHK